MAAGVEMLGAGRGTDAMMGAGGGTDAMMGAGGAVGGTSVAGGAASAVLSSESESSSSKLAITHCSESVKSSIPAA
jgi:hypothetical protein